MLLNMNSFKDLSTCMFEHEYIFKKSDALEVQVHVSICIGLGTDLRSSTRTASFKPGGGPRL